MENKPKEDLIQLAKDIKNNLVFIDRFIPENESIIHIFMVLLFMDETDRESLKNDPPGLIYEYYSEAGPRSMNGFPVFMSFKMISMEDTKILFEMLKKLDQAEKETLEEFQ